VQSIGGKMKSSKMRNKPVRLCPHCYGNDKRDIIIPPPGSTPGTILHCNIYRQKKFKKRECIYFASQAEYAFFCRHLHGKPGVTDIEIHPRVHFEKNVFIKPYGFLPSEFDTNWPFEMTYNPDFRYKKNGRVFYVDVKGDVNPKTNQPRIINLKSFKINCMLMERIFFIDVLVYASGVFWKWNDKPWRGKGSRGKKLEVVG
jgi:hypothetical protein